jgi:hypothetical protein
VVEVSGCLVRWSGGSLCGEHLKVELLVAVRHQELMTAAFRGEYPSETSTTPQYHAWNK